MLTAYLERIRRRELSANAFHAHLGLVCLSMDEREAVFEMAAAEEHVQGAGLVAGGVLASLMDETMAHVVLCGLDDGEMTATIEMQTRFHGPVAPGDRLVCRAETVKRGARVVSVRCQTHVGERLAATGAASFLITGNTA